MSFPVFRTPLPQTHAIRWPECLVGYIVILAVMPAFGAAVLALATWLLKGSGITDTAIGPAAQRAEFVFEALSYSFMMSWIGCILSLPVVWFTRLHGWFGWGAAIVTGVVMMVIVVPFPDYGFARDIGFLGMLAVLSAMLGLAFWLTVRVVRPEAFHR